MVLSEDGQAARNGWRGGTPKKKEFVTVICPLVQIISKEGKSYEVRTCPSGDLCTNRGEGRGKIEFLHKTGYSTPYHHILLCCFGSSRENLEEAFWEISGKKTRQSHMGEYFDPIQQPMIRMKPLCKNC